MIMEELDFGGKILPYGTPVPVGAFNYSLAPAPLPQQPGQPQQGQPQQGQPQQAGAAPLSQQQMTQAMAPTPPSGLSAMMPMGRGMPQQQMNRAMPPQQQQPVRMSTGGSAESEDETNPPIKGGLRPGLTKAQLKYILTGLPEFSEEPKEYAEGGEVEHKPQFFSEGGLQSIDNRYVTGEGDGTSDSVAAMLADGEFVIPADVVASLGNGSNQAGSKVLDEFLKTIRDHKRKADAKNLPPDSKGPLGYLTDAKRKVKT